MAIKIPSASFFEGILSEYALSDDGREELGLPKKYTSDELHEIASSLASEINSAFLSSISSSGSKAPSFSISVSEENQSAEIEFNSGDLFRPSLEIPEYDEYETKNGSSARRMVLISGAPRGSGKYTGGGVKDIFALISHGYTIHGHPVGLWRGKFTRAQQIRQPSPFVSAVAKKYESKYVGLHVYYPSEWS